MTSGSRALARHAERIELTELASEDIGRYIAEVCGPAEAPLALAAAVHRATAGNPLFVQETVRALVTEHGEEALQSFTPAQIKPPEVARDVLRRAAALAAARRRARCSRRASVLGEEFELSLLQTRLGRSRSTSCSSASSSAVAQDLLEVETPQRHRFSHGLLRQVLYDDMKTAERVATHRAAAIALEALTSAEPHHSEIAHHYYCSLPAGDYDRATVAAERAAAAAQLVYAHADAVRYFSWALEAQALDPDATPRKRAELLLTTGTSQRYSRPRHATRATRIKRMFELARTHHYPDLLMRGGAALAADVRDEHASPDPSGARRARGRAAHGAGRDQRPAHPRDEPARLRAAVRARHGAQQGDERPRARARARPRERGGAVRGDARALLLAERPGRHRRTAGARERGDRGRGHAVDRHALRRADRARRRAALPRRGRGRRSGVRSHRSGRGKEPTAGADLLPPAATRRSAGCSMATSRRPKRAATSCSARSRAPA